jgi:hypothetical protein
MLTMLANDVKLNTLTILSGDNKMKAILQQKKELVNVLKLALIKYPDNMDKVKTLNSIEKLEREILTLDVNYDTVYNELSSQAIH